MKLIRLINGTWVKPSAVTCVKAEATTSHALETLKPRVIVMHSGTTEVLECINCGEAGIVADQIACAVNAALGGQEPPPAPARKKPPASRRKKPGQ